MKELIALDPRVKGLEKTLKIGGVAVVGVLATTTIIVGGLTVISAGIVAVGALATVNFLPVAARYFALKKQQGLTKLAETFSEETIRSDEQEESVRVKYLEDQYKIARSELEGAQDELRQQIKTSTVDEQAMLTTQIEALQQVIENAEITLFQRKQDFEELKRVNKLYIAFHRSARALEKSQGSERDPAELQRLEIARTAIKTRMRSAMAGKTIEAMNHQIRPKFDLTQIASIGNSRPIKTATTN
jgi:hypothetical protein